MIIKDISIFPVSHKLVNHLETTNFIHTERDSWIITITTDDYHAAVDKLTEVMVHDIFSPPVASRIYVYPNIAAYEKKIRPNSQKPLRHSTPRDPLSKPKCHQKL